MNSLIKNKALKYEKNVRDIMFGHKDDIVGWLTKYSILHSSRCHLFDIIEDIIHMPKTKSVLDQGAAEGIICRLLQDEGYKVFAVDQIAFFQKMWNLLKVPGAIGDCSTLKWWDNKSHFDVIIATVWVTSSGKKFKKRKVTKNDVGKSQISFLNNVAKCWVKLLNAQGIVYFDVNEKKIPMDLIHEIFGSYFDLSQLETEMRTVLKAQLK